MVVTPFALIVLLIGAFALFRGSPLTMFSLFLLSTLFGGSAAVILTAAGGSSIPPAQFMLGFLILRLVLPGPGQMERMQRAVWHNRYLVAFVAYGVVSAFILPVIFARTIAVTPLKPIPGADLFAVRPLHLTPQNFTTAFYLTGTMIAGLTANAVMQRPGAAQSLVKLGAAITLVHAFLGVSSVLLINTPYTSFLALFRNGNYAQLNQSFDGVVRMNGIWPETSSYSGYGATWCIFMLELWFRDVMPRRTGIAGLTMLLALMLSTSSSAYVSLAAYGLFVLLRLIVRPIVFPAHKHLAMIAASVALVTVMLATMVFVPHFSDHFGRVVRLMTVDKADTGSGIQRAFWAKQGLLAFRDSYGLGIGAGSFRSSSSLTAIIGSMGVIGIVTFLAHLLRAVQPFQQEFLKMHHATVERAIGCAASATALVMLAPGSVSSPTPDPGVLWAVMGGVAIALRPRTARTPAVVQRRREAVA